MQSSEFGRIEKELREMSSRQALFLELCGTTISGMSSWWFENICKTLPSHMGHAVIICFIDPAC